MSENRAKILKYFKDRLGKVVTIDEIAADLLLPPDDVYRIVLLLVDQDILKVVPASIEKKELELVAAAS
jgi:DNA-binding IclR family transcriptional regulator